MKKIFSILAIATLLSCSKDDEGPTTDPMCDCETSIEFKVIAEPTSYHKGLYKIKFKNNCTGVVVEEETNQRYEVGYMRCK